MPRDEGFKMVLLSGMFLRDVVPAYSDSEELRVPVCGLAGSISPSCILWLQRVFLRQMQLFVMQVGALGILGNMKQTQVVHLILWKHMPRVSIQKELDFTLRGQHTHFISLE